jgi:hypothetical protein
MNATREVQIPFSGFYESLWSAFLDDAETGLAESLSGKIEGEDDRPEAEFYGHSASAIAEAMYWCVDYRALHASVARDYAETFSDTVDRAAGRPLRLRFATMESPREYNFTTDRIFMRIPRATVRHMRRTVDVAAMDRIAAERHTSRPGFISSYDPNWRAWGSVDAWDHNQLATLLLAFLETIGESSEDIEDRAREDAQCNGYFDSEVWDALDMDALKKRLEIPA